MSYQHKPECQEIYRREHCNVSRYSTILHGICSYTAYRHLRQKLHPRNSFLSTELCLQKSGGNFE